MIVSYSTIGCPEWSLKEIFGAAVKYNFDAVEFRGLEGILELIELPAFVAHAATTRRMAGDDGIIIQALWTSIFVAEAINNRNQRQSVLDTARRYCDAAAAVGAKQIRVFGGEPKNASIEDAFNGTAELLHSIGQIAKTRFVEVMFETHDVWVDSAIVAELIEKSNCDNTGVAWDIWATSQAAKEPPTQTVENLFPRLIGVQIKDSSKGHYVLPGRGEVPLAEAIELLKQKRYNGPVTLEWEKIWHNELAGPDIALPAYRKFLERFGI